MRPLSGHSWYVSILPRYFIRQRRVSQWSKYTIHYCPMRHIVRKIPCCCDITADWSMVPTTAWIQSPYVMYWARAYIDTVVTLSDMNGAQYNVQPYVQCVTECMYVWEICLKSVNLHTNRALFNKKNRHKQEPKNLKSALVGTLLPTIDHIQIYNSTILYTQNHIQHYTIVYTEEYKVIYIPHTRVASRSIQQIQ